MGTPHKWRRTILITGHGRGGTTWLGDLLKHAESSAYIFEPLTQHRHKQTDQSDLLKTMLRNRDFWMSLRASDDVWFGKLAVLIERHIAELYDISFAGATDTLILKWPDIEWVPFLKSVLRPDKIVYIERNPLAILNSYDRSNLYDAWDVGKYFSLCSNEVGRDMPRLSYILERAGVDRELQILAMCCISHRIAREWSDGKSFLVERYEDLANGGPAEAVRLAQRLNLVIPDEASIAHLFFPEEAQVGFLDTRKRSTERADNYLRELAPWQLRKATRFLNEIDFNHPTAQQNFAAKFSGVMEYARRRIQNVENLARTKLSRARKRLTKEIGKEGLSEPSNE